MDNENGAIVNCPFSIVHLNYFQLLYGSFISIEL